MSQDDKLKAYIERLEAVASAAREYIEVNQTYLDTEEKFIALCEVVDALDASDSERA